MSRSSRVDTRDRGDSFRWVFLQDALAEQIGADVARQIVVVLKTLAPDHVHQSECEGGVGAGAGLDVPVGTARGRAAVGSTVTIVAPSSGPRSSGSRGGCWCSRCSSPS